MSEWLEKLDDHIGAIGGADALVGRIMPQLAASDDDTVGQPLDYVLHYLRRFVAYPSHHAAVAHALWIVHAHLMEAWDSTPRIAFLSPEPGSGKSRALEASELLLPNPVNAVNVSVAYLFRKVGDEEGRPTILYDEVDTVFTKAGDNEDIRGLLNAGHRRHSVVGRCVIYGKRIETEETPAYCAVALAGLGDLPDTILTRSVVVRMRRRAPTEHIEPYRRRDVEYEAGRLCSRIANWAASVADAVRNARPDFPPEVIDRDADVWEALLAVADAAGGEWPTPGATPRLRGRKWMERRASWLRLHPLCCDCDAEGVTRVADEVDHVIPLWKGGADDETNYASRCRDHHAAKTAQEAKERGNASPWGC